MNLNLKSSLLSLGFIRKQAIWVNTAAWEKKKHDERDFYPTQLFLTGHGDCHKYLFQMGKTDSANCRYYGDENNLEHFILECEWWGQ